jgi:hypothetical protein
MDAINALGRQHTPAMFLMGQLLMVGMYLDYLFLLYII